VLGGLRRIRREIGEARSIRVWLLYLPGPGPWLMSWLRKRWVIFRNPNAHIEFQGPVYLGPRFSIHAPTGGTFIVGPGVEFRRGFRAELQPTAKVTIGGGAVFTYDVLIQCATTIDVGERAVVGQCAQLVDGNHRFRDLDTPMLAQGYDYRPLHIADDASHFSISRRGETVIADSPLGLELEGQPAFGLLKLESRQDTQEDRVIPLVATKAATACEGPVEVRPPPVTLSGGAITFGSFNALMY